VAYSVGDGDPEITVAINACTWENEGKEGTADRKG